MSDHPLTMEHVQSCDACRSDDITEAFMGEPPPRPTCSTPGCGRTAIFVLDGVYYCALDGLPAIRKFNAERRS